MKMEPKKRKADILAAALTLAEAAGGWATLTRAAIARSAQCSDGLVSLYFGSMAELRRTVMKKALMTQRWSIVGQGVACGYPLCMKLTPESRKEALSYLK